MIATCERCRTDYRTFYRRPNPQFMEFSKRVSYPITESKFCLTCVKAMVKATPGLQEQLFEFIKRLEAVKSKLPIEDQYE